ncbi:MAG: TRAP transporter TatT component family protein [Thermoanaerobaculia bacterium]|nr:TRAP transporter TatT component family protein [Thermoanaerobaculia bacterium]
MVFSSRALLLAAAVALLACSCSLRQVAVNRVGSAVAGGGASWASDDDPELVRDAAPFALKTIESLLDEAPDNEDLLLAATRGFAQYSFAWVEQDADAIESEDLQKALLLRDRARKLYLRAARYGQRAIELRAPGWRSNPEEALGKLQRDQVPVLYWTALAWGGAISISKDNSDLSADLGLVEQLAKRAMELDETYELGAIHDFYIVYEGGRPASAGGSIERARQHLERARELSSGHRAGPLVTFAETVSVSTQDRAEFLRLLETAIAIDVDAVPEQRLANLIYQRRARWLVARVDELFVE